MAKPPGTPNKRTVELVDELERMGCQPHVILAKIAQGTPTPVKEQQEDGSFKEVLVTPTTEQMQNAAKELMTYMFPKRKAVDNTHTIKKGYKETLEELDAALEENE